MKTKLPLIFAVVLAVVGFAAQAAGFDALAFVQAHLDIAASLSMFSMVGSIKTQGTMLYFLDPEAGTVHRVACPTTITGLTAARDQIETTCLDSEGRTYEAGMPTPGAASFGINADPREASHIRLHELYRAGTKFDWALGWSDGTSPPTPGTAGDMDLPSTRTWILFNGYVADFPFDFALNAVVASTISVQVSDFPQWIPKA